MPKEKVHFDINTSLLSSEAFRRAFRETLKYEIRPDYNLGNITTVICTLEQFARFLIRRNDLDGKNEFKALNPRIVSDETRPLLLDLTRAS